MDIDFGVHIIPKVYSALEGDETDKDYLANVAMAALDGLRDMSIENKKNNSHSEYFREEGNRAYKDGSFQEALVLYNKALAYAPNTSLSLKLAYSNRSAVLFSTKQHVACKKDCDTALAINCPTPSNITEKLEKRRSQAQDFQKYKMAPKDKTIFQDFADDYFKLKSQNKDIPCASSDIDIVFESGMPKVIAKRDIPIGTLVAFEKAFVSWATEHDHYIMCYYCHKLDLNLFPCNGCVVALFCSKQCEEICMKEYHSVECEIVGNITHLNPDKRWMIKAIIKLRNLCASWEELISMSYHYTHNEKNELKINEIYDSGTPTSLLSFNRDPHFFHGPVFNNSLVCAVLLNVIQNLRSFLPQDWKERQSSLKAMARIMMYWGLHCKTTNLHLVTNVVHIDGICDHSIMHTGLFTFIGKLKHSCMPNVQTLSVNNSMALFALDQIEAGTELTISQVIHWLELDKGMPMDCRRLHMYVELKTFCSCVICNNNSEDWSRNLTMELSPTQKQAVQDCFTLDHCRKLGIPPKKCFEKIYKALVCLNNVKFSAEYKKVYNILKLFQMYVLDNKLHNIVLSEK